MLHCYTENVQDISVNLLVHCALSTQAAEMLWPGKVNTPDQRFIIPLTCNLNTINQNIFYGPASLIQHSTPTSQCSAPPP